jgi:ketosteroid isomerase-like protein
MDRDEVDRWIGGYIEAWRTYDREQIAALFSADARYRYHPHDEWVRGRDEIVRSWLGESDAEGTSEPDSPGTWEADYRTIAVDGDLAVVVGSTSYALEAGGPVDRVYDNCLVLEFHADGRCREFTEWYVERPRRA